MKRKIIYIFIGFVAFVITINWIPFMRIFVGEYWYYSNYDGSFRDTEVLNKGRTLESVKRRYKSFIQDHPEKRIDTNLYINDRKNYLVKP